MRLVAALFPSVLVTLTLFVLMHYLINSGHNPQLVKPLDNGFVDLIRMPRKKPTVDPPQQSTSLPTENKRLEPPVPAPRRMPPDVSVPEATPLAIPFAQPQPSLLKDGPYLAPFAPAAKSKVVKRPASPPPKPVLEPSPSAETIMVDPGASIPAQSKASGAAESSGLDVLGKLSRDAIPLLKIEPNYPRKAARARKEGWVKVAFTITEQGRVRDPVVVKSRPRKLFDRSALEAINKWQFQPKLIDGQPVTARATQIIEFKLARR